MPSLLAFATAGEAGVGGKAGHARTLARTFARTTSSTGLMRLPFLSSGSTPLGTAPPKPASHGGVGRGVLGAGA